MDVSPSRLASVYATNLLWNLFLTSTAIHAVALITSPVYVFTSSVCEEELAVKQCTSGGDERLPTLTHVYHTSAHLYRTFFLFSLCQKNRKNLFNDKEDRRTESFSSALWLRYALCIADVKLILLQSYAVVMQTAFLVLLIFYRTKKVREK